MFEKRKGSAKRYKRMKYIEFDRCFLHSTVLERKEKIVLSNIIRMTKELEMTFLCEEDFAAIL